MKKVLVIFAVAFVVVSICIVISAMKVAADADRYAEEKESEQ